MEIEKELLIDLIHDDQDDDVPWQRVRKEIVDTWRWGNVVELILYHEDTATHWSYTWQHQTGDESHHSYSDEADLVELVQVWPLVVPTTTYTTEDPNAPSAKA